MIVYLEEEHLGPIFTFVSERYGRQEEVPVYADDRPGVDKLLGVLERAKMDTYYPDLLDKATHVLIGINKGHFFGNGNKRLALVAMTTFLTLNNRCLKENSKESYRALLSSLFPDHIEWLDFAEFTPTDFATYNLSIIIADSGARNISHDDLKIKVRQFLSDSVGNIKV